jgi:hypothetical protein
MPPNVFETTNISGLSPDMDGNIIPVSNTRHGWKYQPTVKEY